jgi:hypothetical protein
MEARRLSFQLLFQMKFIKVFFAFAPAHSFIVRLTRVVSIHSTIQAEVEEISVMVCSRNPIHD